MVAVIGKIVGDKAILRGCEETADGTKRREGYVFLRSQRYPDGEVLYFEGGVVDGGMYVKDVSVSVSAEGYSYPKAYVRRSLAAGVGVENYDWGDFYVPQTPKVLADKDREQDAAIAGLLPPPLGVVQLWAGDAPPENYALCNGQELRQSDYPALYAVIGDAYNDAAKAEGGTWGGATTGYFRLPDLRGRFVVGLNPGDGDYNVRAKTGGEKQHFLTVDELPAHDHEIRFDDHLWGDNANGRPFPEKGGEQIADLPNARTEDTGGGMGHENRPPYYALAYIMRLK